MNKTLTPIILIVLTLVCIVSHSNGAIVSGEFGANWAEVDSLWKHAGANVIIDSLAIREIDITDIEPIVCYNNVTSETDTTTFVSAIPDDDLDDSGCYKALIDFLVLRELNLSEHDIHLKQFPTGIYLCRVSFGKISATKKISVVK